MAKFKIVSALFWLVLFFAFAGHFSRAEDVISDLVVRQPWVNSLGEKFVPAGTDGILFSVWDVRVKDFETFVDTTYYDATWGMTSIVKEGWIFKGDYWDSPGFTQTKDDPVVGVSGIDAVAFCQWLTKKEQAEGELAPTQEYRLPTNEEWSRAAGTATYPWGDQWPPPSGAGNYAGTEARDANWPVKRAIINGYNDGYPRTSPVESFAPNLYGLYDMGGNVWQWCKSGNNWAPRGGSWVSSSPSEIARSGKAVPNPNDRVADVGFRIVLVVSSQQNPVHLRFTPPPAPAFASPDVTAPTANLTADQNQAVVRIKGDNAEGRGFLVKTTDGPAILTTIHVISDNPHLQITTNTGAPVTALSFKGASDRDLAMIAIKDNHYSYLDLAASIGDSAQPGDEVVIPGNSQGNGIEMNIGGKLLGIGPQRIEFSNPIYRGNSGGPIFHVKSGKVIGIVAEAVKTDSAPRYFGLRMDNVPKWESYDWNRFQTETLFLDQFDKRSRCLDCYLNAPSDNKPEDQVYLNDDKIASAINDFHSQTADSDASQRTDALREWQVNMNAVADTDMDAIQNSSNFYGFDQQRAGNEIAYRKALKAELQTVSDNLMQLDSVLHSSN